MSDFLDVLLGEQNEDDGEPTHRLFGIRPDEISFVDRGANKKKWAVIKSADVKDQSMSTEAVTDAETKTDVNKDGEDPNAVAPPAAAPGAEDPAPPAALQLPGPIKQEILQSMTAALEHLVSLANRVKAAEEVSGDSAELPPELREELSAVQEMIGGIANRGPAPDEEGEPAPEEGATAEDELKSADATPAPAAAAPTADGTEKDDSGTPDLADVMAALMAVAGGADDAEGVEKARTKVPAKKIRDAFKAIDQLNAIMSNFKGVLEGAGMVDSVAKSDSTPDDSKDTKPAETSVEDDQIQKLTETVQTLVGVVKKHEKNMEAVLATPGNSNASPGERTPSNGSSQGGSVWGHGDFHDHLKSRQAD